MEQDIGDELRAGGGILDCGDEGLCDGGVPDEHALDFAGLDAEAADLELLVEAAEKLDRAVGADAGAVARAVEPERAACAGLAEAPSGSVAHPVAETIRGALGVAVVAVGQSGAAEI